MNFVKTTIIDGLLIILPISLVVLILMKVVGILLKISEPLNQMLPESVRYPLVLATVLLAVCAFILGLLAMTRLGKRTGSFVESYALSRVPGYSMMRTITQGFGRSEEDFGAAFVEIEEALVVAFVVEQHDDGSYTVFVPSSPTPMAGTVYVLEPARVHFISAPFLEVVASVSKFGVGSAKLMKTLREPIEAPAKKAVMS